MLGTRHRRLIELDVGERFQQVSYPFGTVQGVVDSRPALTDEGNVTVQIDGDEGIAVWPGETIVELVDEAI